MPGYSLFRCDRSDRVGGGVAVFLKEDLSGDVLGSYDNGVCQLLVVQVHQLDTVLAVLYRPPDTKLQEFKPVLKKLDDIFTNLHTPTPIITLAGDLNFPKGIIEWGYSEEGFLSPIVHNHREGEILGGKQDRLQASQLIDLASKHSMIQQVDKVTHGREILDLVFTNDCDLISSVEVEDWPTFTDHKLINLSVSYKNKQIRQIIETQSLCETGQRYKNLNFLLAPWDNIKEELEKINWEEMEMEPDSDTKLTVFHDKILSILERLVPAKKKPTKKAKLKINRFRKNIWRRHSKLKKNILKESSSKKLLQLIEKKRELEEQLKADYNAENAMEEDRAILNIKTNPKFFFSFARSKQKTKSQIGPFIDQSTGKLNPDQAFTAETLCKQYNSVFSQPRDQWSVSDIDNHFAVDDSEDILDDIEFTVEDIENACSDLKNSASAGPDGVPACLLKNCKNQLAKPLHTIWRASLDTGVIPAELLLVIISPIHKGGSKSVPKNYRPVALTSHLIKVFERVVRKALVKHIEHHNILPTGQHGSRGLRSTLTQLLSHWDTVLDGLEHGSGVDCIYLDFSKAFDKVETGVLLHKLKDARVLGKTGKWLAAFLNQDKRQQAVAVDGHISQLSPVISGVPQGTVLGPILFLLHIADIASNTSAGTATSSYVDDTRVQRSIVDVDTDCRALQSDLSTIYSWAERVNMTFNSEKFECVRYWPGNVSLPDFQYLAPDLTPIEQKDHLRDLGVEISSDLTFQQHISNVVTSSTRMVGWAMRTFKRRSKSTMLTIWKTLIQPKLDYCSQLWSPSDQSSIARLESVQRNFTRLIADMQGKDYLDRLHYLGIYSQERRRERYQIIFI